jgi:hypothetical protein
LYRTKKNNRHKPGGFPSILKNSPLTTSTGRRNAFMYVGAGPVQSTDIKRHYNLNAATVAEVLKKVAPGSYVLGRVEENGFCALFVGRADTDLASELRDWVGESARYKAFLFSYAPNAKSAFERECEDFHDFGGIERLDNPGHPERPDGTDWLCPQCDYYR